VEILGCFQKPKVSGKKTAERIVVELKDKVLPKGVITQAPVTTTGVGIESPSTESVEIIEGAGFGSYHDAVSALLTLGYKATDADQAIRKASDGIGKNASTEELIRKALGR
jgi:Holliday junction DNA helicase RuvA